MFRHKMFEGFLVTGTPVAVCWDRPNDFLEPRALTNVRERCTVVLQILQTRVKYGMISTYHGNRHVHSSW